MASSPHREDTLGHAPFACELASLPPMPMALTTGLDVAPKTWWPCHTLFPNEGNKLAVRTYFRHVLLHSGARGSARMYSADTLLFSACNVHMFGTRVGEWASNLRRVVPLRSTLNVYPATLGRNRKAQET